MPTQREIEEIKQSHIAAITAVMSRYPSRLEVAPVMQEAPGSVLISPFGRIDTAETANLAPARNPATQQLSKPDEHSGADAGIGSSLGALIAGLVVLIIYFRKILE